ncbi:acyl-CoA synthetase [Salinisphaera aquimarina]
MTAELYFDGRRIAGDEVDWRSLRLAGGLAALGVDDGDVIAVMLRNHPVYIDIIQACRSAGCFYCPVNWHFKADEVGYILADSGAKVLIVQADLLDQIAGSIPVAVTVLVVDEPTPAEPTIAAGTDAMSFEPWLARQPAYAGPARTPRGHLAYTSGTTGRPKGVRRLQSPSDRAARQAEQMRPILESALGIRPGVRALVPAPLYHSGPSLFAQHVLLQGDALVVAPRFDPEQTLALIERHQVETVFLVPIMYVRLLRLPQAVRDRYDISSVRFVASTGSPCAPQVKADMLAWWGPVIHEFYASSETGVITVQTPDDVRHKPGSAGRPAGDAVVRIVGEDGVECAVGEAGLIYCHQPAVADFTYQNRDADRQAMARGDLVTVGDIGYLDADGYLFVCDRASDMVISGGVNIYPAEIEAVLIDLPGVLDCAVFGIPDPEYGESLVALVAAEGSAASIESELSEQLRARIAGYKVPRRFTRVADLPRDDNGKIARKRLRAWWLEHHAAGV